MATQSSGLFGPISTSNIERRSGRNLGVTLSAQAFRFTLQIGSTIVLARLLLPADFGLVAMVAVFVNFVAIFKDAGLAQATVQQEVITHEQISTLFWINVFIALALGLTVMIMAPAVAWVYGDSRLTMLTVFLSLPIMISGVSLQHRALLQRNMRFKSIAVAEIAAMLVGIGAGILAALKGAGYWSLVVMQLANAVFLAFFIWRQASWMPGRFRKGTGARKMVRFGAYLTGSNFLSFLSRNSDSFLIGRFLGAQELGLYNRAYGLMLIPITQLNAPITSVLVPTLSRLKDDSERFSNTYLKYVKWVVWLTAIPIASMTLFGRDLVVYLIGPKWEVAGKIFEWLALASIMQPLANLTGVLFISTGMTDKLMRWEIFASSIIVSSFLIGLQFGVEGVAMAYSIAMTVLIPILFVYVFQLVPIHLSRYLRTIWFPLLVAYLMVSVNLI